MRFIQFKRPRLVVYKYRYLSDVAAVFVLERMVGLYQISQSGQWPSRPPEGVKGFPPDFIKKTIFLQSNSIFVTYL